MLGLVVRRCDCVGKLARSAMLQLTLRAGFLSSFSPLHEPKLGFRVRVAPALIRARVRSFIRLRRSNLAHTPSGPSTMPPASDAPNWSGVRCAL